MQIKSSLIDMRLLSYFILRNALSISICRLKCFGKFGLFVLVCIAINSYNFYTCAWILKLINKVVLRNLAIISGVTIQRSNVISL